MKEIDRPTLWRFVACIYEEERDSDDDGNEISQQLVDIISAWTARLIALSCKSQTKAGRNGEAVNPRGVVLMNARELKQKKKVGFSRSTKHDKLTKKIKTALPSIEELETELARDLKVDDTEE
jgi:hypothetical protein